mgnify:FL=1
MFAYVYSAALSTIPPYIVGLTIITAANAPALTPLIDQERIMRLNDVMKDISLNQGRELAARRITQGSPGFILQTVKDLIDYLITCVRGNPEWPGLLRGK